MGVFLLVHSTPASSDCFSYDQNNGSSVARRVGSVLYIRIIIGPSQLFRPLQGPYVEFFSIYAFPFE